MSRPRAETMPAVTVPPRPNGLPTAITQSPTRGAWAAKLTKGKLSPSAFSSARSVLPSMPITLAGSLAVGGGHRHFGGVVDDVVVGDDVAVGRDEEAGALRLAE